MAPTPKRSKVRAAPVRKPQGKPGKSAGRHILVIHGPNLNLLGVREPAVYGRTSLAAVNRRLIAQGKAAGVQVSCFQHNHEGALVDRIQSARDQGVSFIVINPAAYTHSSIALRDALAGVGIPFIEVHLSNIFAREPFRHHSCVSDLAAGIVCGLGPQGYELALQFALTQK